MTHNHLVEDHLVMHVKGHGASQHSAVEDAFKSMRLELQTLIKDPIISVSADAIEVKNIQKTQAKEAFLYFFFKRIVDSYALELNIHLTVKYLNIGGE
ncbi:hypothetical protein AOC36_07570 [Erysipelothrix larvae]|uniref:Uncharacterized protein n=1 Tax=Erysipelothrix larvae TaxID=1514105 RepID=A0A0X8H0K6_9FIRM|nr:DUF4312 family protein [Erysipelothrix larvae]AMC93847.1 hypothetical protein AOC36_07570 [Erysipelothrix larvae]